MSTRAARRGLAAADLKDQLHDIQDNVVAPILMRYGRHIFVKFGAGPNARRWLRHMFDCVNLRREGHGTHFTVNIGFTWQGLKAMGLSQRSLDSFPQAFRAGMRERAHLVGDVGPHAPEHWEGGLGGPDIHAMAWVRTDSAEGLEAATRIIRAEMEATGDIEIRFVQDTMAEGADAPSYPGDDALEAESTWRALRPGEFLLGYEDEAGVEGVQAPDPQELRLNGTYVVFRKLYQDVAAFRRYLANAAKALYGSEDQKRATAVRRHRLIRRGVEYGPHLEAGALQDDGVDRGLVDLFIQADIERQFEFVQKERMMGGELLGLDAAEQDPITGAGRAGAQTLIPGAKKPFPFDLPNFVRVKGGEYLFVPGLNALEGLIQQRF